MNRLSLIKISNAVSAEREMNVHQRGPLKCICMSGNNHGTVYDANRW